MLAGVRSKPFKKDAYNLMAEGGARLDVFGGGVVLMDAADATRCGVERRGKRFSYRAGNEFVFVPEAVEH